MKWLIHSLFLILFIAPWSINAQVKAPAFPQQGVNCGVPYPVAETDPGYTALQDAVGDVPPEPDFSNATYQKYACCAVEFQWTDVRVIPEVAADVPGLNWIIDPLEFILNPLNIPESIPFVGYIFPVRISEGLDAITSTNIAESCAAGSSATGEGGSCYCQRNEEPGMTSLIQSCKRITSVDEQNECIECLGFTKESGRYVRTAESPGIWTGIGCVETSISSFIEKTVFGVGLGLAGVVSLGCIIYASILLQISAGNSERLENARELLKSCIIGLVIIIFSTFILRVIGVDILRIPGFGG